MADTHFPRLRDFIVVPNRPFVLTAKINNGLDSMRCNVLSDIVGARLCRTIKFSGYHFVKIADNL